MRCPFCEFLEDKVLESRLVRDGEAIKRRRECLGCSRRFTTYEQIEERRLRVVKKDGRREAWDRQKVLRGLELACRKRPVSSETLEGIVDRMERELYDRGVQEISAGEVGEMAMEALRGLDAVAYVRFASVYRDFGDLTQFQEILEMLRPGARRRSRRPRSAGADSPD